MWLSRCTFAAFAVLTLGGCRADLVEAPRDALDSPERVLELARTYLQTGPSSIVIEARASQYSERGGLKGKLEILAERPGRVRFTGLSPTDDMVSVLSTDGDRFVYFQRGASVCHVGRACASNVGRFVTLPLESDELVGALVGRPPIIPFERATMTWDRQVGAYLLELTGGASGLELSHGRVQKLWVAHADGRILRTALLDAGRTRVDIRYSDFAVTTGQLLPRRLDVRLARDETDLRLDFRDIDIPPDLEDEAFRFTCPAGTILEELSCDLGGSP
jgi:outer membrane lipoprotein-sorting protein